MLSCDEFALVGHEPVAGVTDGCLVDSGPASEALAESLMGCLWSHHATLFGLLAESETSLDNGEVLGLMYPGEVYKPADKRRMKATLDSLLGISWKGRVLKTLNGRFQLVEESKEISLKSKLPRKMGLSEYINFLEQKEVLQILTSRPVNNGSPHAPRFQVVCSALPYGDVSGFDLTDVKFLVSNEHTFAQAAKEEAQLMVIKTSMKLLTPEVLMFAPLSLFQGGEVQTGAVQEESLQSLLKSHVIELSLKKRPVSRFGLKSGMVLASAVVGLIVIILRRIAARVSPAASTGSAAIQKMLSSLLSDVEQVSELVTTLCWQSYTCVFPHGTPSERMMSNTMKQCVDRVVAGLSRLTLSRSVIIGFVFSVYIVRTIRLRDRHERNRMVTLHGDLPTAPRTVALGGTGGYEVVRTHGGAGQVVFPHGTDVSSEWKPFTGKASKLESTLHDAPRFLNPIDRPNFIAAVFCRNDSGHIVANGVCTRVSNDKKSGYLLTGHQSEICQRFKEIGFSPITAERSGKWDSDKMEWECFAPERLAQNRKWAIEFEAPDGEQYWTWIKSNFFVKGLDSIPQNTHTGRDIAIYVPKCFPRGLKSFRTDRLSDSSMGAVQVFGCVRQSDGSYRIESSQSGSIISQSTLPGEYWWGEDGWQTLWDCERDLGIVAYDCDTKPGFSGSPVLSWKNGWRLHGVHAFGSVDVSPYGIFEGMEFPPCNYFVSFHEVENILSSQSLLVDRTSGLMNLLSRQYLVETPSDPGGKRQGKPAWRDRQTYHKANMASEDRGTMNEAERAARVFQHRVHGSARDVIEEERRQVKEVNKEQKRLARPALNMGSGKVGSGPSVAISTRHAVVPAGRKWADAEDWSDDDVWGGHGRSSDTESCVFTPVKIVGRTPPCKLRVTTPLVESPPMGELERLRMENEALRKTLCFPAAVETNEISIRSGESTRFESLDGVATW